MRRLVAVITCVGALVLAIGGPERSAAGAGPVTTAPNGQAANGPVTGGASASGQAGMPVVTAALHANGNRDATTTAVPASLVASNAASRSSRSAELSSTAPRLTFTAPESEELGARCPAGMVEVEGDYCPTVEQKCLRWLDPETQMRCAEFAPATTCSGKTVRKHFCIDMFEYPNAPGARPVIMKTWYEARDACQAQGKRLCGDSEWTLACEGQERLPYPYGYARNADACNIDKPHPDVNEAAIANPKTRDAEVQRLWQGEPSGTRDACVSPYGVHDMTGNVDEWVVNEKGVPYKSGLKGGYWGPVRTRCRPMTTVHNEDFMFYQIGFRCCSDPSGTSVTPTLDLERAPVPAPRPAAQPVPVLGS